MKREAWVDDCYLDHEIELRWTYGPVMGWLFRLFCTGPWIGIYR